MSLSKERRDLIVRDTARMSFQLIADREGLTRNQVAGIVYRHKNPVNKRRPGLRPRRGPGVIPPMIARSS